MFEEDKKVLSLPLNNSNNGVALTTSTYLVNSDYRDEWLFWNADYSYDMQHYYDYGHAARFGDSQSYIKYSQSVVSNILLQTFGIVIDTSIEGYSSCADLCFCTLQSSLEINTSCSIHKTRAAVRNDLILKNGLGDDCRSKYAWTGHVMDGDSSNSHSSSHTVVMTIGQVTDDSYNNLPDIDIKNNYIYILLHETSHQLGAPDHYCYDENSNNCNNPTNDCWRCDNNLDEAPDCLMSGWIYDLEDKLNNGNLDEIYCPQCMSSTHSKGIFTHLDDHH